MGSKRRAQPHRLWLRSYGSGFMVNGYEYRQTEGDEADVRCKKDEGRCMGMMGSMVRG